MHVHVLSCAYTLRMHRMCYAWAACTLHACTCTCMHEHCMHTACTPHAHAGSQPQPPFELLEGEHGQVTMLALLTLPLMCSSGCSYTS